MLREDRRPLAAQLRDRILAALQSDGFGTGERLPSEQDMVAHFRVSRATVREALKLLEEERVIFSRHGVGHFLSPEPGGVLRDDITRLRSVTELAQGLGISTKTHVLSLREEPGDATMCASLELEPRSTVVIVERVRLTSEPVIYSVDIFPRRLVTGELQPTAFEGSLISVMEGQWGLHLAYAKSVVSAATLDADLCQRIGVTSSIPWILMEQVNYDPQDHPFLCSRDYHRGDKIQFRVLRRRR